MLCRCKRDIGIIVFFAFSVFFASCMPRAEKKVFVYSDLKDKNYKSAEFSKIYELSKNQNYEIEGAFSEILEAASLKTLGKKDEGYFSYSLSPEGAVYPFSKVSLKCVFSSDSSYEKARDVCREFFNEVDVGYLKLMERLK